MLIDFGKLIPINELEISNMKLEIIKVLIKFLVINDEKSYGKILKATYTIWNLQ